MNEPKPFDLEAAKRGEAIMQRDGTPVKFIAYEPEAASPLIILRGKTVCVKDADGTYGAYGEPDSDLVMAPKKRKVVVRLYRHVITKTLVALVNADPGIEAHNWTLIDEWTKEVPV